MQHNHSHAHHCHSHGHKKDYLLWGSLVFILLSFLIYYVFPGNGPLWVDEFTHTVVDLMIKMSWGLVFAIAFVGLLNFVPKEKVNQVLGTKKGLQGLFRATAAGLVLDLCNHGILLIAMKLYERGVRLGQVIAFLVASPWNSFSMTLILWSLVGLKPTLAFILLSCLIAIVTGLIFEKLVDWKVLPGNPNKVEEMTKGPIPWVDFQGLSATQIIKSATKDGLSESGMILRWIFFGVLLTAGVKVVLSPENFEYFFGPDMFGVLMTIGVATVLEVCSEGSAPLASEIVTTAKAPGNGFSFLMAGVSTDYTEIMAMKETTKSWKVALFLPLITLPQIIVLGIILNMWSL